jgi:hypothetical protein
LDVTIAINKGKEGMMPFEYPMRPYNLEEILRINPNQIGVYGIFRDNVAIYIGSGDLRQRMLDHIRGDNTCIAANSPKQWAASVVSENATALERQLIQEYQPVCNQAD